MPIVCIDKLNYLQLLFFFPVFAPINFLCIFLDKKCFSDFNLRFVRD